MITSAASCETTQNIRTLTLKHPFCRTKHPNYVLLGEVRHLVSSIQNRRVQCIQCCGFVTERQSGKSSVVCSLCVEEHTPDAYAANVTPVMKSSQLTPSRLRVEKTKNRIMSKRLHWPFSQGRVNFDSFI